MSFWNRFGGFFSGGQFNNNGKPPRRASNSRCRRRMRFTSLFEQLEDRRLLAYSVELVKDLNRLPVSSDPRAFVEYEGRTLIQTNQGLWATNGTEHGTVQVNSVSKGRIGDDNRAPMVVSGDYLYFIGTDSTNRTELWRTDGTAIGTIRLTSLVGSSAATQITAMVDVNGMLFFAAEDTVFGSELYKSDGTVAGTQLVRDLVPGAVGSRPTNLVNYNGSVYFSATSNGLIGLWKSDGTAVGTQVVYEWVPASVSSSPSNLVIAHDTLYFVFQPSSNNTFELWSSDGTVDGTVKVQSGLTHPIRDLVATGDKLFYTVYGNPRTLWVRTADGGSSSGFNDIYGEMTAAGDVVFFNTSSVRGLAFSDGVNTSFVTDAVRIRQSSMSVYMNGFLYFWGESDGTGAELWKTDGTSAGTVRVKTILPDARKQTHLPAFSPIEWNDLFFGKRSLRRHRTLDQRWHRTRHAPAKEFGYGESGCRSQHPSRGRFTALFSRRGTTKWPLANGWYR